MAPPYTQLAGGADWALMIAIHGELPDLLPRTGSAFALFTKGYNSWWPGHHIGTAEMPRPCSTAGWRPVLRTRRGRQRVRLGQGPGLRPAAPDRGRLADQRQRRRVGLRPRPVPRQRVRSHLPRAARRPDPGRARAPQRCTSLLYGAYKRPVPSLEPSAELGALGGTRTPNLLIRSKIPTVQINP